MAIIFSQATLHLVFVQHNKFDEWWKITNTIWRTETLAGSVHLNKCVQALSFPFHKSSWRCSFHQLGRLLSLTMLIESPHYSKLHQRRMSPIWVGAVCVREIWLYLIMPENDQHMKKQTICKLINKADNFMWDSHENNRQSTRMFCFFFALRWAALITIGVFFPKQFSLIAYLLPSTELLAIIWQTTASRRRHHCLFPLVVLSLPLTRKKLWMNEFETSSNERMSTSCSLLFRSNCGECQTLHAPSRRYQFLHSTMERFFCFSNLMMDIIKSNREERTLKHNYMRMKLKIRHFFVWNFKVFLRLSSTKWNLYFRISTLTILLV